jgi:inner membrane protein YidH
MMDVQTDIDQSTRLAFERTRVAQERTLLAWVRTAISLITFGFTIYSVFAIESAAGNKLALFYGPRIFSLVLIATGLVSLALATAQHLRDQALLRSINPSLHATSQAWVLGLIVAGTGVLAFVLLLARPFP